MIFSSQSGKNYSMKIRDKIQWAHSKKGPKDLLKHIKLKIMLNAIIPASFAALIMLINHFLGRKTKREYREGNLKNLLLELAVLTVSSNLRDMQGLISTIQSQVLTGWQANDPLYQLLDRSLKGPAKLVHWGMTGEGDRDKLDKILKQMTEDEFAVANRAAGLGIYNVYRDVIGIMRYIDYLNSKSGGLGAGWKTIESKPIESKPIKSKPIKLKPLR